MPATLRILAWLDMTARASLMASAKKECERFVIRLGATAGRGRLCREMDPWIDIPNVFMAHRVRRIPTCFGTA
jgi:hypothetical protein